MALEPITGDAPSYWASYLINGDASGLDPEERDLADAFVGWLGGRVVSCGDDEFFAWRHDASQFGVGGATCVEYMALVEVVRFDPS